MKIQTTATCWTGDVFPLRWRHVGQASWLPAVFVVSLGAIFFAEKLVT